MTIGLILLSILSVLIFFGLMQPFCKRAKLPDWLIFAFILVLSVGALVGNVKIFNLTINAGGVIAPSIVGGVLFILLIKRKEVLRGIFTFVACFNCVIIVRMLMQSNGILSALIIGFLSGAAAFLMGGSSLSIIFGTIVGTSVGESISTIIKYFLSGTPLVFGGNGIFNAMIVGVVFANVIKELVRAIELVLQNKKQSPDLNFESASQFDNKKMTQKDEYDDYFDDDDMNA